MSSSLGFLVRTMLAVLIAVPIALLTNCSSYDELVEKEVIAAEKWANVEAQLQRRHDLVPQLVAVVKGSAAHERGTLEAVIQARALATSVKLSADDLGDPAKMAAAQRIPEGAVDFADEFCTVARPVGADNVIPSQEAEGRVHRPLPVVSLDIPGADQVALAMARPRLDAHARQPCLLGALALVEAMVVSSAARIEAADIKNKPLRYLAHQADPEVREADARVLIAQGGG